jgi:hypothetical protein
MELSLPFLAYVGSWVAITGGIWTLFSRAETVTSPEAKVSISRWLKNVRLEGTSTNWPSTFADVFDSIFGKRHFSWRCFWRSCVASIAAVVVMTLIWAALRPQEFKNFLYPRPIFASSEPPTFEPWAVLLVFLGSAFLNFIPDYLSLLESRYVLRLMRSRTSSLQVFALLIVDLLATAAIALCVMGLFTALFLLPIDSDEVTFSSVLTISKGLILGTTLSVEFFLQWPIPIGVWFYSTFFTSVWVWLYALSGLAVKVGEYLGITLTRLRWALDIENKPLHSLGMVSILLVSLIYLVIAFYKLVA